MKEKTKKNGTVHRQIQQRRAADKQHAVEDNKDPSKHNAQTKVAIFCFLRARIAHSFLAQE